MHSSFVRLPGDPGQPARCGMQSDHRRQRCVRRSHQRAQQDRLVAVDRRSPWSMWLGQGPELQTLRCANRPLCQSPAVDLSDEGNWIDPQSFVAMRILLADGESNVRYGLRVLLEERSEFEVVGEAADAEDLLAQIEAACPDLCQ